MHKGARLATPYSAASSAQDDSTFLLALSAGASLAAVFALLRSLRLAMISLGDEIVARQASSTRNLMIGTIVASLVTLGVFAQPARGSVSVGVTLFILAVPLIMVMICVAKYIRTLNAVGKRLERHALGEEPTSEPFQWNRS